MLSYGFVALGGAAGSVLRFGLNRWLSLLLGETLPWGTILINVVGSFAIGLFAAYFESNTRSAIPLEVRQFVLVGLCGGFTTFSSFSLQTLVLLNAGEAGRALLNVALSVALCLVAVALGYMVPNALAGITRSVGA
ncbi:fluoride efflux transporter CrcB [Ancylobacter radicis]|uniref:Fluoride-specific ion channel FluC n=1 Tax=Ancylobacter radicis TaxID=2836179 RepID=A0ABS5R7B0_9HYPH|nr:fluoride efflux transporter CrcB [Ancylobacter radicis]MBS9477558.1 fluoride efflux transporter CrcB [Ancylobacter radicis]